MSAWPPPPDLASLQELVRNADTEGFIALQGAPADEYDSEAEDLFASIGRWPTDQITEADLIPVIERIWRRSFSYDQETSARTYPALLGLAQQIARFFGPGAKPQVRDGNR
jgi:hypothetical protein